MQPITSHKPTDLPDNDPGLGITELALNHVRRKVEKMNDPNVMGIRVGVKKAGCSGYEYVLTPALKDLQKPYDYAFGFDNIHILIDKEIYLKFLKGGTVLDFKREGINEGLEFKNPNVANQCGCGESFTLVDEE